MALLNLKHAGFIAGFVVFLLWPRAAWAANPRVRASESEIKAAYLYNFALFTTWPKTAFASQDQPFMIAILGDDPFKEELDKMVVGKTVGRRRIIITRVNAGGDVPACHLLFISSSEKGRIEAILRNSAGKPILTVSDVSPFCRLGGCIRFERQEKNIGLVINPKAVAAAKLRLDSELLAIARIQDRLPE